MSKQMKALGAAAGALAVKNTLDNIKSLSDVANVNISITAGGSKQEGRKRRKAPR